MVAVLVDGREQSFEGGLAAEGTASMVDVRAKLIAELDHVARHRHRRGVAEWAQALPENAVADIEEQVELGMGRAPCLDRLQDLHHPARPLAARRAFPARLVHVELRHTEA